MLRAVSLSVPWCLRGEDSIVDLVAVYLPTSTTTLISHISWLQRTRLPYPSPVRVPRVRAPSALPTVSSPFADRFGSPRNAPWHRGRCAQVRSRRTPVPGSHQHTYSHRLVHAYACIARAFSGKRARGAYACSPSLAFEMTIWHHVRVSHTSQYTAGKRVQILAERRGGGRGVPMASAAGPIDLCFSILRGGFPKSYEWASASPIPP